MKTIGLIGGVSYPSTIKYYEEINKKIAKETAPSENAKIVINSINFEDVAKCLSSNDHEKLLGMLYEEIQRLIKAQVDLIGICSNTLHYEISKIQQRIKIPIISIVEETIKRVHALGISKVGIIGLRAVTESDIYIKPLEDSGIEVIFPSKTDRRELERIILEELNNGIILDSSQKKTKTIISLMESQGAKGIVLACTALSTLINPDEYNTPILDTLEIHVNALVREALLTE